MMPLIYRTASNLVVWLGEGTTEEDDYRITIIKIVYRPLGGFL